MGETKVKTKIRFEVRGKPVPWARSRTNKGVHFTAPRVKDYQQELRMMAQLEMKGLPLIMGPVNMGMSVHLPIPKKYQTKKLAPLVRQGLIRPTTRPDVDNYIKIVMDALQGVVFEDDKQVVNVRGAKCWAHNGVPCMKVTIEEIGGYEEEE